MQFDEPVARNNREIWHKIEVYVDFVSYGVFQTTPRCDFV